MMKTFLCAAAGLVIGGTLALYPAVAEPVAPTWTPYYDDHSYAPFPTPIPVADTPFPDQAAQFYGDGYDKPAAPPEIQAIPGERGDVMEKDGAVYLYERGEWRLWYRLKEVK